MSIDKRIEVLRTRASVILISIACLLIACVLLIIFAGSLTSLDVSAANDIDKLESALTTSESRAATLLDSIPIYAERDAAAAQGDKDAAQKKLTNLLAPVLSGLPPTSAISAKTISDSEFARVTDYKELVRQAWQKEINSEHGYGDAKYLIATAVTRVGVVLIIIFLVQILLGLYRYNTKLVTFYLARRDLMQLWNGNKESIVDLEKIVTPSVEFGREPRHPIDDIVKRIIDKIPSLRSSADSSSAPKTGD